MLAAVAETCGAGPGQISVGGRGRFSKSACSGPASALHPPISTGWPGGPRTCRPHDALQKALPILRRHSINSKPSLLKCPPPPFSLGSSFFVVFPWPPAAPSFPSTLPSFLRAAASRALLPPRPAALSDTLGARFRPARPEFLASLLPIQHRRHLTLAPPNI